MARSKSLTTMSIEALVELRESISATLNKKAKALRNQLASLTDNNLGIDMARRAGKRSSSLKGRKVAAKYRSKKNPKLTWAGRGAIPRWMREEMRARKLKK
jgi:DNA-binding protein H-NS